MSVSFVRKDIKLDQPHYEMLEWLRVNVSHDTFPVQTVRRLVRSAAKKHGYKDSSEGERKDDGD